MPGGLLTDLYELHMAASYLRRGMTAPATFSVFARNRPPDRGFLVAAGLESCLSLLEDFSLEVTSAIMWLSAKGVDITAIRLAVHRLIRPFADVGLG